MNSFSIFSTKFKKIQHYFFARLEEKYKWLGNFEKTLKFFNKNLLEKLNFYLFLEKLLLKIEPSEITSFFYNNFSISSDFHIGIRSRHSTLRRDSYFKVVENHLLLAVAYAGLGGSTPPRTGNNSCRKMMLFPKAIF